MDDFKFDVGDVVLAEWGDKLFYAKIQKIHRGKSYCHLIFDDNSVEECPFSKIHSVTETTAEIVCIICKDGNSAQPNEIVLCDKCGIGYHQKCHDPPIPAKALELDEPWMCTYCSVGAFCPYLENPFESRDKRNEPLRNRQIHPLSGENTVVTTAWNSQGHRVLTKKQVGHGMSGFYYTSQHREGSRQRGRPPFSQKKHIAEKRGRGLGRSPNRNQTRERDHQGERDKEEEVSSRKHHNKHNHSEMQHRTHSRYSSPSRNSRHGDDMDSSGSDRSQGNKDCDSNPRKENTANKSLTLVKHHRRDPPREKQRLTQDLARQKRLLSEDLARNQLLQREQITNNFENTDKKDTDSDSALDQCESVKDNEECINENDTQLTMYEKCYGNSTAASPGDESNDEIQRDINSSRSDNAEKSLFERMLNRNSLAETKHIEFVNESQLKMRSDDEKNDIDRVISRPLSPSLDPASRGDLNRKVKLPVFENVTDDEMTISDNEAHHHINSHESSSNSLVTEAEIVSEVKSHSSSLNNHSSEKVIGAVSNAYFPKDCVNDYSDKMSCECSTNRGSDKSPCYNGNDSKEMFHLDQQSDHSNSSKMSQILDEPDMQCEHSLKNENFNHENDGISSQRESKPTNDNILDLNVTNEKDDDPHGDIRDEFENSKDVEQDTDVSNNEGMSEAEELSDLEPVTSSGKTKIKRKTRKRPKSSKTVVKTPNSPQRQPRRSKAGRRLGRPPKGNKQTRQIDSDSDAQDNVNCESKDGKSLSPSKEVSAADSTQDVYKQIESNQCEDDASKDEEGPEESIEEPLSPDSLKQQDSDTEDANQDIFSLTDAERLQYEEQVRKERARKDKRIAARQKRKSVDRDREKERATPPHLVSQNRFARDLPRHNWLVERLLQQKKLGQEALKQDENENSDNAEGNSDEESKTKEEISTNETNVDIESEEKLFNRDTSSECADSAKDNPSSPIKDDFQSELHRSFLRRSFPPNVPRSPPKLKPASPENNTNSDNKTLPPPLKHKLHSKEHSVLEPVPKLKKIIPETTKESEESAAMEQGNDDTEGHKDDDSSRKQQSPIEILDDEEEKKKADTESEERTSKSSNSPVNRPYSPEKLLTKDEDSTKRSSFSPPKKPQLYSSSKKIVHSVSPTLPGTGKDLSSQHPMGPHHRAAILIPVVPMHDANGMPLPSSLGPPSPHMKPYSPRTFTPHLITHNPPFSSAGLFSGPPPNRYPAGSCHHFHPGIKPGPCKRDVNCPFHGSHNRAMPGGILGIPSHHPGSMGPFSSPHEHISQMLAREREHREGHCPNSDCKLCRQDKESPKIRELDSQSNSDKKSPQPNKVVKPIAHVPGMRPPLMLSHLQQFGMRPSHSFSEIDSIKEEKARRSGLDPLLSPRTKLGSTSPERTTREPLVPGLFPHERRSLPQSLTLSDLNRRREQEFLKVPHDGLNKRRSLHGDFIVPGFSPPSSLSKTGLIHPKDSALFSSGRSQSLMTSQTEKRDLHRMEDRDRSPYLPDPLKSGPPRLRPLDEKIDVHTLRNLNDQKSREELARREGAPITHQVPASKEGSGLPPAKLFEDREGPRDQPRDQSIGFSRPNKDYDMRLLSGHGNSSILGPGLRNLEDNRKIPEEERKGLTREEREQEARRTVESETRERELREEQAMNALEASHRRSIEQMREKEQEKRAFVERDAMRGLTPLERDRMKQQLLRGPDSDKHFKASFGRDRSPPFLRREMFHERLMDPSKTDHRLDMRSAPLYDLQRRQELFRATDGSHRELLGRIASSYSANKAVHPADKHFHDRFHPEMSRPLADIGSHSPTRGYPLSLASRQAMDRLAAAAQGKSITLNKEMDKEIPIHLRSEMEREREKERHRLSLEQIDVNRRLLQAELKEKVNPLVLNREIGPRDREKEMAALRARERLMIERERHMAFERLVEDRRRKRDAGELDGPFLARRLPSPPYARGLSEFERAKRMRLDDQIVTPSLYGSLMTTQASNSFDSKSKDDRLTSPKGVVDQRLSRPLDLESANKTPSTVLEREALWIRERERAMRAKEELSRLQPKVSHTSHANHLPAAFVKERPEGIPRDSENSGKQPDDDSVNLCSVCKREASFLCSGCQGAWYCSTECQLSAWAKHSRDCGQSQRQ